MRISLRSEYALRALVVLGLHYGQGRSPVQIHQIAAQQNIPKRFLEQILNDLKSAGVVESRRGTTGGYRLRLAPEQITLARVLRHLEGPLAPVGCVSERFYEPCSCPDEGRCAIRSVMLEVRAGWVATLERHTLGEVCQRARQLGALPATPQDFEI
ncbi:MAG: Rrf2 family transcriptional regulator [Verrucomicrobia bacterium]|nr:Rrf2 family transcriptional regulator [Verrucomicrobiota bacterium]